MILQCTGGGIVSTRQGLLLGFRYGCVQLTGLVSFYTVGAALYQLHPGRPLYGFLPGCHFRQFPLASLYAFSSRDPVAVAPLKVFIIVS